MMRGNGNDARLQVIGSALRHAGKALRARIAQLAAAPHAESSPAGPVWWPRSKPPSATRKR